MHFFEELENELQDDYYTPKNSLDFIETEEFERDYNAQAEWQRKRAVEAGYNFNKFKEYVLTKIKFEPSEDMFVLMYESFCCFIACIGDDINVWGKEYCEEEWKQ